jgi:hypothetical protein
MSCKCAMYQIWILRQVLFFRTLDSYDLQIIPPMSTFISNQNKQQNSFKKIVSWDPLFKRICVKIFLKEVFKFHSILQGWHNDGFRRYICDVSIVTLLTVSRQFHQLSGKSQLTVIFGILLSILSPYSLKCTVIN